QPCPRNRFALTGRRSLIAGHCLIPPRPMAENIACPSPDPAAAAATAANLHCAPQSRFRKYRSPAGPMLRNGKRNVHTRAKLLRYIPSQSGFRLAALFSRFACAALPAWLADIQPGPVEEYPAPAVRNTVRKVSALRHPDSNWRRCDPSPSGNRRAMAQENPPPALHANVSAVPPENTFARAMPIPVLLCKSPRGTDCLRNRTRAAHAAARPEFLPAWIFPRAT